MRHSVTLPRTARAHRHCHASLVQLVAIKWTATSKRGATPPTVATRSRAHNERTRTNPGGGATFQNGAKPHTRRERREKQHKQHERVKRARVRRRKAADVQATRWLSNREGPPSVRVSVTTNVVPRKEKRKPKWWVELV